MLDIVIISVPGVMRKSPQAAPALLKGSVEAAGFTCNTIDFSIRFYHEVADSSALETYFATGLNVEEHDRASALVENWTKDILKIIKSKPISFEVFADDFLEMERQAEEISSWGDNVYVKIPITNTKGEYCYPLVKKLSKKKIKLNITALMTLEQVRDVVLALDT